MFKLGITGTHAHKGLQIPEIIIIMIIIITIIIIIIIV